MNIISSLWVCSTNSNLHSCIANMLSWASTLKHHFTCGTSYRKESKASLERWSIARFLLSSKCLGNNYELVPVSEEPTPHEVHDKRISRCTSFCDGNHSSVITQKTDRTIALTSAPILHKPPLWEAVPSRWWDIPPVHISSKAWFRLSQWSSSIYTDDRS